MPDDLAPPVAVNHLVLNVRDMAESHRFWTEVVGMKQVGVVKPQGENGPPRLMQFYSANHDGHLTHHDIALMERPELPAPAADGSSTSAIDHIAIKFANREAWLGRLAYLQTKGIKFERRVEHGMSRSLYIRDPNGYGVELLYELPRAVWEGNIQAALDHHILLPTDGEAALVDRREETPVFSPEK
jgi:catechol 2,3-dioxygenase